MQRCSRCVYCQFDDGAAIRAFVLRKLCMISGKPINHPFWHGRKCPHYCRRPAETK